MWRQKMKAGKQLEHLLLKKNKHTDGFGQRGSIQPSIVLRGVTWWSLRDTCPGCYNWGCMTAPRLCPINSEFSPGVGHFWFAAPHSLHRSWNGECKDFTVKWCFPLVWSAADFTQGNDVTLLHDVMSSLPQALWQYITPLILLPKMSKWMLQWQAQK